MKKILLCLSMAACVSYAYSQGAYVSIGSGIAGSASPDNLGSKTVVDANGDATETAIYGTYGQGIPINLRGGYMMSENVGIELGFNYLMGSEIMVSSYTATGYTNTLNTKSSQMRLLPTLVMTTGSEGLNLYTRFGLVLPIGGSTTFDQNVNIAGIETIVQGESKGAFSLGYLGAAGISYGLSEKMSLFGEFEVLNLRIKGASQKITTYTVAGVDVTPGLDREDLETTYVDSIGPNDNQDSTQPSKELAETANYSSSAFQVGIKINF